MADGSCRAGSDPARGAPGPAAAIPHRRGAFRSPRSKSWWPWTRTARRKLPFPPRRGSPARSAIPLRRVAGRPHRGDDPGRPRGGRATAARRGGASLDLEAADAEDYLAQLVRRIDDDSRRAAGDNGGGSRRPGPGHHRAHASTAGHPRAGHPRSCRLRRPLVRQRRVPRHCPRRWAVPAGPPRASRRRAPRLGVKPASPPIRSAGLIGIWWCRSGTSREPESHIKAESAYARDSTSVLHPGPRWYASVALRRRRPSDQRQHGRGRNRDLPGDHLPGEGRVGTEDAVVERRLLGSKKTVKAKLSRAAPPPCPPSVASISKKAGSCASREPTRPVAVPGLGGTPQRTRQLRHPRAIHPGRGC